MFETDRFKLRTFEPCYAENIRQWVLSHDEAAAWAATTLQQIGVEAFARWHAHPDIHPSLLMRDGVPIGYGEVWDEPEDEAVELARLIIAPLYRGRGNGRILVEMLCASVAAKVKRAFLRLRPDNMAALRCYERCGFRRVAVEQERVFNASQPTQYVWLSHSFAAQLQNVNDLTA